MRDLLRAALGADRVLGAPMAARFNVRAGAPALVVAPHTAEEAAAVMQLAVREGLAIECAGSGSRLAGGNAPARTDIVLTSSALTAVTEYEPADLVITVQSGARMARVNGTVAEHNQFLALDPAVAASSTLGSTLALGSAGPLRFAHGTPRDQVLGLEIVSGDGRVLHFGGRVVKNVAGYDVVRLLVGSRGTLAFITQASLRLKPLPEVDQTALMRAESFAAAAAAADAVYAALDAAALEIISAPLARELTATSGWALLVRITGNRDAVADGVERVRAAANGNGFELLDGESWTKLAAAEAAAPVNIRLANLPSQLRETVTTAMEFAAAAGLANERFAMHAGDGIVRVLADGAAANAGEALRAARETLESAGGTLIVEKPPAGDRSDAFGSRANTRLMAELKQVFDPAGILGMGRFVV